MYKKLFLVLSLVSTSLQVLATTDDQPEAEAPQVTIKAEPLTKLIASLITLCPNPNCSKKIDALPKTKKIPGGIYPCGYSYRASCPVCGDERNILFFEN